MKDFKFVAGQEVKVELPQQQGLKHVFNVLETDEDGMATRVELAFDAPGLSATMNIALQETGASSAFVDPESNNRICLTHGSNRICSMDIA
ncbi:MAG: hypothetical protein ACK4VI_01905 [Alphaproteobacteria bacterium]